MCDMKANLFPASLMDFQAAVFPFLLMTCCNGDECSVRSNAIFWHSAGEKGILLNTIKRKLLLCENRNSGFTINLGFSPTHCWAVIVWGTETKNENVCGAPQEQTPSSGSSRRTQARRWEQTSLLTPKCSKVKRCGCSHRWVQGRLWGSAGAREDEQAVKWNQLGVSLGKCFPYWQTFHTAEFTFAFQARRSALSTSKHWTRVLLILRK